MEGRRSRRVPGKRGTSPPRSAPLRGISPERASPFWSFQQRVLGPLGCPPVRSPHPKSTLKIISSGDCPLEYRWRRMQHLKDGDGPSMVSLLPGETRQSGRCKMNFPVTVEILQPRKKGLGLEQGWLRDLGVDGARFYLSRSVPIGARIILDVHFPGSSKRVTTVRFEGSVVRRVGQEPRYEISVRFGRRRGRFLRDESTASQDPGPSYKGSQATAAD